jgi:outer membrane translocation and assembly module TamA
MQLAATGENFSPEHLLQTHRNENAQHFNQITIKQESKRLKAQYLLSLVVGAQANWKRM